MTTPTLKQLIESKKFDYVNSDIEKADWGVPKTLGTDFKLYYFDRFISSEDAIKEMERGGYRAATIYELLSWTGWNGKDSVVALGSVEEVVGGRCVSYLDRGDSGRLLGLLWWGSGWDAYYRFLGVRNGSQDLGSSTAGDSDALNLYAAIEKVKKAGYVIYKKI